MAKQISNDLIIHSTVTEINTERETGKWSARLTTYLRLIAGIWMLKGLFHWAVICGFIGAAGFTAQALAWQAATVFFAMIDLIAAVGLWLAASWGVIVWLAAAISFIVVSLFFPQVYGVQIIFVLISLIPIGVYLFLAVKSFGELQQHKT